ncbi:phosphotriesterase (plasmid) [Nocardioides sp. R1-1]|uniref:phosphotriesterase family protein n=1 Tax=Nocardioides sp. R1-1 TaxID=3383502 RepID=UPI0038D15689
MMHEHIGRSVSDDGFPYPAKQYGTEEEQHLASSPVSLENLWWVRYHLRDNLDNVATPADDPVWLTEVSRYAAAGGGTLVEVTPAGVLDAARLIELSQKTNVHVVLGTGWYIDGSYPDAHRVEERDVSWLADKMTADILKGDAETGAKAGIIGEIGCSWPLTPNEAKVLRASAIAQANTGVSISVHPGRNEAALGEIRDILHSEGADLSRVIMGHMDRCGYELDTRKDIADSGVVLEYDVFGLEGYYPAEAALADGAMPEMPNDTGRIKQIMELMDLGYRDQIVVGHDIHMKMQMTAFGGWGYGHFLRNVVPLMKIWGMSSQDVDQLIIDNPNRLLAMV